MPKPFDGPQRLHSSNPNLSTLDFGEEKNNSDGSETSSEFSKMQEDLCHIAHKGMCLMKILSVCLNVGCPWRRTSVS